MVSDFPAGRINPVSHCFTEEARSQQLFNGGGARVGARSAMPPTRSCFPFHQGAESAELDAGISRARSRLAGGGTGLRVDTGSGLGRARHRATFTGELSAQMVTRRCISRTKGLGAFHFVRGDQRKAQVASSASSSRARRRHRCGMRPTTSVGSACVMGDFAAGQRDGRSGSAGRRSVKRIEFFTARRQASAQGWLGMAYWVCGRRTRH